MVYLAETPAGALVEALVHLELLPDAYPTYYGLLKAKTPDQISIRTLQRVALPSNWLTMRRSPGRSVING